MKKINFKQHLFLLLILLISPLIIYNFYHPGTIKQFNPPLPYTNNNIYDKFLLGAMDEENGAHSHNYAATDSLELNVSHAYADSRWNPQLGRFLPHGRIDADSVFADVNDYKGPVTAYLSDIYNNHNGRRTIAYRPKITWLCYGQSSIYQAEDLPLENDLWFYSYNRGSDSIGQPEDEQGRIVIHCRPSNSTNQGNWVDNPGYVCKRLKANTEQCSPEENFNGDVNCDWFVKPMIKIPVGMPDEMEICKIHVKQYFNQTVSDKIQPVILRAKHFRRFGQQYNGGYIEEFYFNQVPGEIPQGVTFHGNLGDNYWFNARGSWSAVDPEYINKADIKVEWLGNCDMWIDYVKVENDVADRLLKGNDPDFEQWIQDEVDEIAFGNQSSNVPLILKYYIELTEFNNYPCMAYVNQKLKQYSEPHGYTVDLMADFTPAFNFCHISWNENFSLCGTSEWLWRNYINRIGFTQFFAESYPLTSVYGITNTTWSQIPNTLPSTSGQYALAVPQSPGIYDTWLQGELNRYPYAYETNNQPINLCPENSCGKILCEDKGNFRYIMKLGSELSRNHNIPFIFMPQAQLWYLPTEVRREPTNEELNMMANVAVSYSAKGLQWFWFRSENGTAPCSPYEPYSRGMVDASGNLLTTNAYNQAYPKWQVFRDISQRMKAWESSLLNFDNSLSRSYIYQTERNNLLANTYFYDVASYIRGNDAPICNLDSPDTTDAPPPENLKYECFEDRYLQVATFKKSLDDPDKYFMIVNRRCSPVQEVTHNDGERYVRVFFDRNAVELQAFNNWSIIDIETGQAIDVVNIANITPYADLGWFDPGEGKLYKMTSTAKTGGILAGDENITGESFTCEAPVYNNGHNITIGANTTIHFNDSSRFVMDGGVFTVGDQNTTAPQNITSDAVPGGSWRGHSFTNCEVKIYGATFTGHANDTTYAVNIVDCPVVDIRNCTFLYKQLFKRRNKCNLF